MAIDFSPSNGQGVGFGSILSGLATKTFMFWLTLDTNNDIRDIISKYNNSTPRGWYIYLNNNVVEFQQYWSGTVGRSVVWQSNLGISNSTLYHIAVSYDWGSTSNNPSIYRNGVAATVTESANPPLGSPVENSSDPVTIGGFPSTFPPIDGRLMNMLVYNRILSAAEILEAYNSRKAIPTYNGLVFAPQLNGAAGLQTFGGATLAAGNTIVDSISGAIGTPSGSPIGVGDTILTYGG